MNDIDYKLLLNLYEQKSISRVARQQYMTQSALTKRIRHIEEELCCQLVVRSKQGVAFTPIGESVIASCRAILQEQNRMRNAINHLQGVAGGTLLIGCSLNFCRYRLPQVLLHYRSLYPQVDIKIRTGNSGYLYNLLSENKLDLAIVRGDHLWDDSSILLASEPLCLVRSNNSKTLPLSELTYIDHHTDSKEDRLIYRWIHENSISIDSKLWIDDIGSCKEMAESGVGWSILPSICLDHFNGDVLPLHFKDGSALVRNTYILYRPTAIELLQVKSFIDVLTESVPDLESPQRP